MANITFGENAVKTSGNLPEIAQEPNYSAALNALK